MSFARKDKEIYMSTFNNPHADQPVLSAGPAPADAAATLILIHGRGASAEDMLSLHRTLNLGDVAALAPQAYGHTWYPHTFLAPLNANQPYLDSALAKVDAIVNEVMASGVPAERIAILGFSQGACLTSEYAARHPRRYGAVIALTGGLIGPPGTPRNYTGSLDETPAFLGSSDPDPHVPIERVLETKAVLTEMGAKVDLRRYPGMPHTINQEEIAVARELIEAIAKTP
jgi:predicted esterase